MKLLLENGADVNKPIYFLIMGIFADFNYTERDFRIEICLPIAELILQHASIHTLSEISLDLFNRATKYSSEHDKLYEEPREAHLLNRNILYRVIKLFLESGARPSYPDFIICIKYFITVCPNVNTLFWMELLRLIVPHMLAKNIGENYDILDYMESAGGENGRVLERGQQNPQIAEKLKLLKQVWNKYLEEINDMQNDELTQNLSVREVLPLLLCGIKEKRATVRSDTAYELMLRIAQGKYPHFNDIMSHALKTIDLNDNDVYFMISRQHFGLDYVINQDCFVIIAKYLSKNDLFNFLLALFIETSD